MSALDPGLAADIRRRVERALDALEAEALEAGADEPASARRVGDADTGRGLAECPPSGGERLAQHLFPYG